MRLLAAVALAACASAPRPAPVAAPAPAPAAPPASAPVVARAPTTGPISRPVTPPPASAPVAASPPAAPVCLDRSQLELPTAIWHAAACDLPSRIIVVGAVTGAPVEKERESVAPLSGTVKVYVRSSGRWLKGSIAPGSTVNDLCQGTHGGHAGCSMLGGQTISSPALEKDVLVLGNTNRDYLHTPQGDQTCRGAGTFRGDGGLLQDSIAACSTAKRFALVTVTCEGASLALFEGDAVDPTRHAGEVDPAGWTFRSTDAITLTVDRSGKSAEFVVGGEREPCLAWWAQ